MIYGTEYSKSYLSKYGNPKTRKPLTDGQIAHYGLQLLQALKFLHDKGLPHGMCNFYICTTYQFPVLFVVLLYHFSLPIILLNHIILCSYHILSILLMIDDDLNYVFTSLLIMF